MTGPIVALRRLTCEHGDWGLVSSSIPSPWCRKCEDTVEAEFIEMDEFDLWLAVMLDDSGYVSEGKASDLLGITQSHYRIAKREVLSP